MPYYQFNDMPFPTISTLEQLQYNLNLGSGYDGYTELMKAVSLTREELAKICRWSNSHHTRICLYDTPGMEALITCWEGEQQSTIHNYDFNNGWVKILQGQLWLEFFKVKEGRPQLDTEMQLYNGSTFHLNDTLGYHRFSNRSTQRAIALILYSDKLTHWKAYNEETEGFEVVRTHYDLNLDPSN